MTSGEKKSSISRAHQLCYVLTTRFKMEVFFRSCGMLLLPSLVQGGPSFLFSLMALLACCHLTYCQEVTAQM